MASSWDEQDQPSEISQEFGYSVKSRTALLSHPEPKAKPWRLTLFPSMMPSGISEEPVSPHRLTHVQLEDVHMHADIALDYSTTTLPDSSDSSTGNSNPPVKKRVPVAALIPKMVTPKPAVTNPSTLAADPSSPSMGSSLPSRDSRQMFRDSIVSDPSFRYSNDSLVSPEFAPRPLRKKRRSSLKEQLKRISNQVTLTETVQGPLTTSSVDSSTPSIFNAITHFTRARSNRYLEDRSVSANRTNPQVDSIAELMMQAKLYTPPWARNNTRRPSMNQSEEPEDEDVNEEITHAAAGGFQTFYMYVSFLAVLVIADLATYLAIVFHDDEDFLCKGHSNPQSNVAPTVIISVIVVMHFIIWVMPVARALKSNITKRSLVFGQDGMYAAVLVLSIVVFGVHHDQCAWGLEEFHSTCKLPTGYAILVRLHQSVHLLRCVVVVHNCWGLKQDLRRWIQAAVSGNKRRFIDKDKNFDLDLTYICDRIIAMALPCVNDTLYRNDIREVGRFFALRHYGTFWVINLSERHEESGNGNYDAKLLYNQVLKIPFRDHNICALRTLVAFCERAMRWLDHNSDNVLAIHCQGGKGRTGAFVVALMMWSKIFPTASKAMRYYADRRTDLTRGNQRMQCVSAPCQIRYLYYLQAVIHKDFDYISTSLCVIDRISIRTRPLQQLSNTTISFVVESNLGIEYDHGKSMGLARLSDKGIVYHDNNFYEGVTDSQGRMYYTFQTEGLALSGDVSIRFFVFDDSINLKSVKDQTGQFGVGARELKYGGTVGKSAFFVTLHTSFYKGDEITFDRQEIDGAFNKPVSKYHQDFQLRIGLIDDVSEVLALEDSIHSLEKTSSSGTTAAFRDSSLAQNITRSPSFRSVQLDTDIKRIFNMDSVESSLYDFGETVYDTLGDRQGAARRIGLIMNGHVIFEPREEVAGDRALKPNLFANQMVLGIGDFIGEQQLILGSGADKQSGFVYRTHSETVQVHWVLAETNKRNSVYAGSKSGESSESNSDTEAPTQPSTAGSYDSGDGFRGVETSKRRHSWRKRVSMKHSGHDAISNWESSGRSQLEVPREEVDENQNDNNPNSGPKDQDRENRKPSAAILTFKGLEEGDVAVLFEVLAMYLVRKTKSLGKVLANMALETEVKHDIEYNGSEAEKIQLIKNARSKFTIPIHESCLLTASATIAQKLQRRESVQAMLAPSVMGTMNGQFFVFESKFCFYDLSREIELKVSEVSRVETSGDIITIFQDNPQTTKPEPPLLVQGSPPSSNRTSSESVPPLTGGVLSGSMKKKYFRFKFTSSAKAIETRNIIRKKVQDSLDEKDKKAKSTGPSGALEVFEVLGYIRPGERLSDSDIEFFEYLKTKAEFRDYTKGQSILSVGDTRRCVFHVIHGSASVRTANGTVLVQKGRGEIFGEYGFFAIGNIGAMAQIVADTDVKCMVFTYELMERICITNPSMGIRFFKSLATIVAECIEVQYATIKARFG